MQPLIRPLAVSALAACLACAQARPAPRPALAPADLGPGPTGGGEAIPGDSGLPSPLMPGENSIGPEANNAGAEDLLRRGFAALAMHPPAAAAAAVALRDAVATQDLSDAGRALAYWHIYVAEQALGPLGHSNAALADFIAVGEDVLAKTRNRAEVDLRDFVSRFDLRDRVARGRATQSLAWSRLTPSFGHSLHLPVPVESGTEMRHFIALAPPCAGAAHRVVAHKITGRDSLGYPIAQVTLSCPAAPAGVHYYFSVGP